MLIENELKVFLKDDYSSFINDEGVKNKGVAFCATLHNVKKRVIEDKPQKQGFSGFLSSISDKFGSMFNNSYIAFLEDGTYRIMLSQKEPYAGNFSKNDLEFESTLSDGLVKIYIKSLKGDTLFQSGEVILNQNVLESNKVGSMESILEAFCDDLKNTNKLNNLVEGFYHVLTYEQNPTEENIFSFQLINTASTLLSNTDSCIHLLNLSQQIPYDSIVSCYKGEKALSLLCLLDDHLVLYELCRDSSYYLLEKSNLIENLISKTESGNDNETEDENDRDSSFNLNIRNYISVLEPQKMLMAASIEHTSKNIYIVIVDDVMYVGDHARNFEKVSFFIFENNICFLFRDRRFTYYQLESYIIDNIKKLEIDRDDYFRNFEQNSVVLLKEDLAVLDFGFNEKGFIVGEKSYQYTDIKKVKVETDEFNSLFSFIYEDQDICLISSKILVYELWRRADKTISENLLSKATINGLYQYINNARVNRLLLGTFGEIAKSNRLVNKNNELGKLMEEIAANEGPVLRSALTNMKSKFVQSDDLQQRLLVKVSEIELQRKIIVKLLDEWATIYPHYLGLIEVKWLKYIFGNNLDSDFVERERWKVISSVKRLIQQAQYPIHKYLSEIQICTQRLHNLIPDEVKKIDTSNFRRVPVSDFAGKVSAGSNIALGIGTGAEVANMFVRSAYFTNPVTIAISTKMLVDSYIKDDMQRRDIKIYGFQTLVWWETMINSLDITIIEVIQGMKTFLKGNFERDKALFNKVDPEFRQNLQKKMATFLAEEFRRSTTEKFIEVIPSKGIFASNIMDDINNMYTRYEQKLVEFGKKVVF